MINIQDLHKSYGDLSVLKGVSLRIPAGQITSIVGPNGSGKTTLIKCLLGLVKPDSGQISIDGARLNGDFRYRASLGYMPQLARFPENLTGAETLTLLKSLRNGAGPTNGSVPPFDLGADLRKKTKELSGGTRQKLSACAAFLFSPTILILDEPTAGLDPIASFHFKKRIREERDKGATIILTSHIMSEVQSLSDNIVFLLDGKIRFDGKVERLLGETGQSDLEAAVASLMEAGV